MTKSFCDRCGRELTDKTRIKVTIVFEEADCYDVKRHYDLCPFCMENFKKQTEKELGKGEQK